MIIIQKHLEFFWQYWRHEDDNGVDDNGVIVDFTAANAVTDSFKIKGKITGPQQW